MAIATDQAISWTSYWLGKLPIVKTTVEAAPERRTAVKRTARCNPQEVDWQGYGRSKRLGCGRAGAMPCGKEPGPPRRIRQDSDVSVAKSPLRGLNLRLRLLGT